MTTPRVTVPVRGPGHCEYDAAAHCVTLAECPPGLFCWNGTLGFKSEYGAMEPVGISPHHQQWKVGNRPDAYCADSGEYFWGGTSNDDDRAKLLVYPIAAALATREEAPAHDFVQSHSVTSEGGCKICGRDEEAHEAPAEAGGGGDLTPERVLSRICDAQKQHYGNATALHLAMLDLCIDGRAALSLRAQPQAREDAQPVAWRYRTAPHRAWFLTESSTDAEYEGADGSEVQPLYTHPAPDALRDAVEALKKIAGWRVTKLSCDQWADTYSGGHSAASERCADVADKALAALQAEQGAK